MGFRLLPGDNRQPGRDDGRLADAGPRGPRYAVRVAGRGRSEIDGVVSVLRYRDCVLLGSGTGDAWSPLVIERADGVELRDNRIGTGAGGDCCVRA
jgi:hypothetical protein